MCPVIACNRRARDSLLDFPAPTTSLATSGILPTAGGEVERMRLDSSIPERRMATHRGPPGLHPRSRRFEAAFEQERGTVAFWVADDEAGQLDAES